MIDKSLLKDVDERTLANWWCILNRWQWPSELGEPEKRSNVYPMVKHMPRRYGYMEAIAKLVDKDLLDEVWLEMCPID